MDFGDGASFLKVGVEKEIQQGLKKKLVKKDEGYETPENGDEVEVHYTGTLLDGTKFDSSRDRGMPFKFTLGLGKVITGWDIGIKMMKKGENDAFTIPSELAYGEFGSPPTIAAIATLSDYREEAAKDALIYSYKDSSNWYVVRRAPPRGYHELETEEDLGSAPLPVQEVEDLDGEQSDDCEGLLVVD